MSLNNLFDKTWFQKLSLLIVMSGSAVMLYLGYLLFYPVNPIKVVQPYKVVTPSVPQGDRLVYEVEYCLDEAQNFVVHRELFNTKTGELWDVPDRINYLPANCVKEVHDLITPMRADLGTYKMIARVSVKVNPVRWENYQFETEVFEITPAEEIIN